MKYTIVTINSEGYYATQTIEASTFSTNPHFVTFKKDKKILMIAADTVVSISTDGYDLEDKPKKSEIKKEQNAKILHLVKGQK